MGANKIIDNLYMGSAPPTDSVNLSKDFDCLILSAIEFQPPDHYYKGLDIHRALINDDGSPMTFKEMQYAIRAASYTIKKLNEGKRVLVTCWQGRNRSGIITALVLTFGYGKTPTESINMIRDSRGSGALGNDQFVSFLNEFYRFKNP
jgi:protein-tyrosine phosphatase